MTHNYSVCSSRKKVDGYFIILQIWKAQYKHIYNIQKQVHKQMQYSYAHYKMVENSKFSALTGLNNRGTGHPIL